MTNAGPNPNRPISISLEALAALGEGEVAYVRSVDGGDVQRLFPGAPDVAPGHKLWALLGANGAPILLADTPQAAIATAINNNLMTVSVH